MDYNQVLQQLMDRGGSTHEMSLDSCLEMRALLGCPDEAYRIIHVAGTNGKGTVCTKLAACLQKQGYKTGLFTSPHIETFRERIQINGQLITENEVVGVGSYILQKNISITCFEAATFLALEYFKRQNVDWVVLETGLGGRLDATNVVMPDLCIITSIAKDHTHVLGNTIEEIALEKAGIIKKGVPVIIGPSVPYEVISAIAKTKQALVYRVPEMADPNTALVIKGMEVIGVPVDQQALAAMPPCRFECFDEGDVVMDVAHNPDGLRFLFEKIKILPQKPLRVLFGLSRLKDVGGCLSVMKEYAENFHVVSDQEGHCLPPDKIPIGIKHTTIESGVEEAIALAKQNKERLVICGSFYIMKEARCRIGAGPEYCVQQS